MYHIIDEKILFNTKDFSIYQISPKVMRKFVECIKSSYAEESFPVIDNSKRHEYAEQIFPYAIRSRNFCNRERRIEHLVLNITRKCNLRCQYCYSFKTSNSQETLSSQNALRAIQTIKSLDCSELKSIKFLGGEPLLFFPTIRHIVEGTIKFYNDNLSIIPNFILVTNGTILRDTIISFLKRNKFKVFVSLDGDPNVHNIQRPHKSGSVTYQNAFSTVKCLLEAGIDVSVECVYTSIHTENGITPLDILQRFNEMGIRSCVINPVAGEWHGLGIKTNISEIITGFQQLVRYSVFSMIGSKPIVVNGIRFVLESLFDNTGRIHFCEAGSSLISIDTDGKIYPCYLLQSQETEMGDISNEDFDDDKFNSIRQMFLNLEKNTSEQCQKCWAINICKTCLGRGFLEGLQLTEMPDWFCNFQRSLIEEAIISIVELYQHEKRKHNPYERKN